MTCYNAAKDQRKWKGLPTPMMGMVPREREGSSELISYFLVRPKAESGLQFKNLDVAT